MAAEHFGLDPLKVLDTRNGFERLLLRALVEVAEERRARHNEELMDQIGGG